MTRQFTYLDHHLFCNRLERNNCKGLRPKFLIIDIFPPRKNSNPIDLFREYSNIIKNLVVSVEGIRESITPSTRLLDVFPDSEVINMSLVPLRPSIPIASVLHDLLMDRTFQGAGSSSTSRSNNLTSTL